MLKLKSMRIFLVIFLSIIPLFFSQAESLYKEDARAYREEGYRAQSLGDLEGALSWYQKAAQMDPHYAQVYNDIGVVYENQGQLSRAEEMYKKALEIDPGFLPTYTNLAFIAEKKGNITEASHYWQKRYELGQEGEYWWEVSRQHLLKLGTYPKVRKQMLEKKAAALSRDIIKKSAQEKLATIREARLRFDIGNQAFLEKDYTTAIKEFEAIFFLNPDDEELLNKSVKLYKQAKRLYLRGAATAGLKNALDYVESDDYQSAEKKLKDTLEVISRITQGK